MKKSQRLAAVLLRVLRVSRRLTDILTHRGTV